MVQSSTSLPVAPPTSNSATDNTVHVETSLASSITENIASPTEQTSYQQRGVLYIMFVYTYTTIILSAHIRFYHLRT